LATSFDVTLFWVAFWCYLAGFLVFSVWLALRKSWLTTVGMILFACGFVPQTVGFVLRWNNTGHFPMSNMYEYLAVMSWMAALSFGFLTYKYRQWIISALISPVIVMLMVSASLLPKEPSMQLMPALKSNWLAIHVSLASIGAGAFAVGAAVSMILLLFGQEKDERGSFPKLSIKEFGLSLFIIPIVLLIAGGAMGIFAS
jgi:ABC-type transport system involved in cytochrome c biogenesis permease subunit